MHYQSFAFLWGSSFVDNKGMLLQRLTQKRKEWIRNVEMIRYKMLPLQPDDWADCLACQQPTIMKSDRIFGAFFFFIFYLFFPNCYPSLLFPSISFLLYFFLFCLAFFQLLQSRWFLCEEIGARARALGPYLICISDGPCSTASFKCNMYTGILSISHFIDQYKYRYTPYILL